MTSRGSKNKVVRAELFSHQMVTFSTSNILPLSNRIIYDQRRFINSNYNVTRQLRFAFRHIHMSTDLAVSPIRMVILWQSFFNGVPSVWFRSSTNKSTRNRTRQQKQVDDKISHHQIIALANPITNQNPFFRMQNP